VRRVKRRKGWKVHVAVDTLGHLLVLKITAADQGDWAQVAAQAEKVQKVIDDAVQLTYVDQGLHRITCRQDRPAAMVFGSK
jgi:hypothetical protein